MTGTFGSRRARFLGFYFAAWTPLTLAYALLIAASEPMPLPAAVLSGLVSVLPAALLGLAAWQLGTRVVWARGRRVRFAVCHVLGAATYAVLWGAAIALEMMLLTPGAAVRTYMRDAFGWQLVMGLLLYGVVAGVAFVVQVSRQLRERDAAAVRAESLRAQAELKALRAQLDPHFLFNTLHSLGALMRSDPASADAAIEHLATLLRYVLDASRMVNDQVALADEITFVRTYLALEQLRLGDRLRLVEHVEPDTLECAVPVLSLQPLVENAIRHGIAPLPRGGTLRLAAHFSDDRLVIEVGDDGSGAEPDVASASPGVGLSAVRERLLARHGAAASVQVVTAPGQGFLVRLAMPVIVASPTHMRSVPETAAAE